MIQDIAPKKLYNEYRKKAASEEDFIFVFSGRELLAKRLDGQICLPRISELRLGGAAPLRDMNTAKGEPADRIAESLYLFCIDQDQYFLYPDFSYTRLKKAAPESEPAEHGPQTREGVLEWISLAQIRGSGRHELSFAVYTAYHLYQWYRNNQYCGCCGARTVPDQKERMLSCPSCGNQIYPRINPAVIVAVTNGDKILLTRYANREYQRYALIAGFTEIGETAEETVRREVMEETGVCVKNIRYYKSQPWGIDGNLLLGYFAELDGSEKIRMDAQELAAAEWKSRAQLKDMDDSFSLTREMMRAFYERQMEN